MRILILNKILFTAEKDTIPAVTSIKDTMIYNLCLGFKQLGHAIPLAAAAEYRPQESEAYDFEILFFESKHIKIFPPSVLPYSTELYSYIKQHHTSYDLLISSEIFSFQSLFAAGICPEKTVIWQELTAHQNKFHRIPSKIWHNVIARLFMQKVSTVIPRSAQAYDFICKYMHQTSTRCVEHGINVDKFTCSTIKKRQIISSSQLIRRKNIDGIIRIYDQLHKIDRYRDIKLLIAGRGEEETNLRKLVSDLNLTDYVDFLGFLPQQELNLYIKESLCFLINTRKDLNVVSIPESIVSGTPVLTNTRPASASYIKTHKLGVVQNQWGIPELEEIIDNNGFYVKNCIAYRDKLSNTHIAQTFLDIFRNEKS